MQLEIPTERRILTLCLIHDDERILLGLKKRGFGMNRWNGFGGKVQPGEFIEEAAKREVLEEANLTLTEFTEKGLLFFSFDNDTPFLEIHVFHGTEYSGEPQESEEMKPQWFLKKDIPYSDMWADDPYWLPLFLEGKSFTGHFHFKDNDTLLQHEVKEV